MQLLLQLQLQLVQHGLHLPLILLFLCITTTVQGVNTSVQQRKRHGSRDRIGVLQACLPADCQDSTRGNHKGDT